MESTIFASNLCYLPVIMAYNGSGIPVYLTGVTENLSQLTSNFGEHFNACT